jgi:hypothetical protein
VWKSTDGGKTYPKKLLIDPGQAMQSSLQFRDGKLLILHEQADEKPDKDIGTTLEKALLGFFDLQVPTRFVVREVPLDEL